MSTSDDYAPDRLIASAIVAYLGYGVVKIPRSDAEAVRALAPEHALALLQSVRNAVERSDSIDFADVEPFDDGLRERLYARLRNIFPGLGDDAIRALGWRWGYVNFR